MTSPYYTLPAVTSAAAEPLRIYTGWNSLTRDERLAALACLLSRLRNTPQSPLETLEAVLACFTCAIPELSTHLSNLTSVNPVMIMVTPKSGGGFITMDLNGAGNLQDLLVTMPPHPLAVTIDDSDGLHAGVASILMAIGRQGGSGPEAATVRSRPAALISRFELSTEGQKVLPGREYGPSQETLAKVYVTFANYTEIRMRLVQHFLAIGKNIGHLPIHLEIIMTNFRLMRGAGMSHVSAITKLMTMHPWTVRVPELTPYYHEFARELREFNKIPDDVRNYHRLLVPQADFFFVSAQYRPLIAVAGNYVKDVESTFRNYVYNEADHAALIAQVRRYEPSKARYLGAGQLASLLGIQDVELPPLSDIKDEPATMS